MIVALTLILLCQLLGEVIVRSEVGRGATFTLYLPRAIEEEQQTASRSDDIAPLPQGACILVVEDNSEVGSFATQALAELGLAAGSRRQLYESEAFRTLLAGTSLELPRAA